MIDPPYDPEEPMLPVVDGPPKGPVVDHDELIITREEAAAGNHLGSTIRVDDDEDNGLSGPRLMAATPTGALTAARNLAEALQDYGVKVSIELMPGASSSGYGPRSFVRNLSHHTVSRPSNGLTPCLSLVKNGRSDLSGPLCNGYGGYDRVARIITLGYANHPGLGGPWSVPGWGTVPQDNGRPYIFGWEFEGGYSDSWVGSLGEAMHDFMARCNAATLDWLTTLPGNEGPPAPILCQGEHKTWAPGRKIDRYGYTTASGQALTAKARASKTSEEDDMFSDADRAKLDRLFELFTEPLINGGTLHTAIRRLHAEYVVDAQARTGVLPEDSVQAATAYNLLRYADGNALQGNRNTDQIISDLTELQTMVAEILAAVKPETPPVS
jgi:hypothetical protein